MIQRTRSIRLRIVLIYCLLVFIAVTIIGVFIMSETGKYLRETTSERISTTINKGTLLSSLSELSDLNSHREEAQKSVDLWGETLKEEIFVIDENFNIVAATNYYEGLSALSLLDENLILKGLSGEEGEKDSVLNTEEGPIPVLNKVYPIKGAEATGVVYIRADLSSVEDAIKNFREIFLKAMAIALLVTLVLGFLIARSITEPINHVTDMAERMAEGDFSREVKIKSKDEIGDLAQMFNLLRIKLNETLSLINSEKNKLEAVLSHMADGLIAVDKSGNIIHLNQAALDLLKTNISTALTSDYDSLIEGILYEDMSFKNLWEKSADGAGTQSFETGGYIYNLRYDKFQDEAGEDSGLIIIIQDITERYKLENMQMDFVANVSHELKTPLTTIKSYTETMLEADEGDRVPSKEFLTVIDEEADRMARLVSDLLKLSRLEYKREETVKREINICELLKDTVSKVKIQSTAKGQQFNLLFDECLDVKVMVDKDQMEQVLLNLVTNAIKYTDNKGRIDIDLRTDNEVARIMVRDNGVGIPEKDVSRVFERFFRVDKARSREMGGTGLGLAISKQIVENHGGKLFLESKEGKGTTVTLLLPLRDTRGIKGLL
ncbi:MAG: ATP-binding protein [Anaerovoracaceae bacterium]